MGENNNDDFCLSQQELNCAQTLIDSASPGRYTLKKLYGNHWTKIAKPNVFGTRFVASVNEKQLTSIEIYPQKTAANAMQYDVHGGAAKID